jgi:hypothetical protein
MAVQVLDIKKAAEYLRRPRFAQTEIERATNGPEAIDLLDQLVNRKLAIEPDQAAFAALCDRWDNLYYPQGFTKGGASHWANNESAWRPGRAHVSVNTYPTYVDVPAALQSVVPIENMVATEDTEQMRQLASMVERLYFAWKAQDEFELKFHQTNIVKSLYGRTAGKVYWSTDLGHPVLEVIDQPRNLYLGWRDSDYSKLEWALYCYQITPTTALEDWGLRIDEYEEDGKTYPYVVHPAAAATYGGSWHGSLVSADLRVEVYDYWYRKPAKNVTIEFGKPTRFDTWNAIFVGNVMVKNERHLEYKGVMPYVPLFNTYIPGMPTGRPEFYDIEQLIREKDERMSENAQMISRIVNGQMWQLTGQEAPNQVPAGLRPTPNNIIAPGAGNRVESIQPWAPEFQMEQYLGRIDRELTDVSGLNDLLRGMAPSQVLSSGKAISALVANYETRISMKRDLAYNWRRDVWELVAKVWAHKNSELRPILLGSSRLDIEAPTLTPRDDAETATVAGNLAEPKLWSSRRAMDGKVGADRPSRPELDVIRTEQTDATLNPAAVQTMVTLLATLQQLGQSMDQLQQMAQQAQGGGGMAPGAASPEQMADANRQLGADVTGQPQMNGPGEQPVTPAEQQPGNTQAGAEVVGQPGPGGPSQIQSQFMIKGGESTGRIVGESTIQRNQ